MHSGRNPDVIVVGAGNAALAAAIAAREAGATVLVLEKAPPELRGGNTRFSGGVFRFAYSGLEDILPLLSRRARSSVSATGGAVALSAGRRTPDARRRGGALRCAVSNRRAPGGGGGLRHQGGGLAPGRVRGRAGVSVRGPAGPADLEAPAVILACGGFEANPEMRARYLGPGWDTVIVRGTASSTGEMLDAVLRIGGQPHGHWSGCHATPVDAAAPRVGDLRLTDRTNRLSYPYGIMVNTEGRRFVDEGEDFSPYTYARIGRAILAQPQNRAWQIFDQQTVDLLEERYATGRPVRAETLAELAEAMGVPRAALEETVATFNAAARAGRFDPTARDGRSTTGLRPPKSNWALPLESPPFVAYPVTCGITFTYGGLRVDEQARVLDTENKLILGLYATGEITGGFFYFNYPAGAGLMRGAVFGRMAGEESARLAVSRRHT